MRQIPSTLVIFTLVCAPLLGACGQPESQVSAELEFEPVTVSDSANLWWARAPADLNGDRLTDVALIDDNGHGGWLGWLEAGDGGQRWTRHIIAETAPDGQTFAAGDLEAGDIDRDGDVDLLAFGHPGEWDDAGAPTTLYWYENGSAADDGASAAEETGEAPEAAGPAIVGPDSLVWTPYEIGQAPDFVKDVSLADLDGDLDLDVVTITYEENALSVFRQDDPDNWTKATEITVENLHEGMDVGDVDGDGDLDVVANGYWIQNPGGTLGDEWTVRSIHERWHNQTGDWSKNATKVTAADVTGDGRVEVFISHSERGGYPLAWYETEDPIEGPWTEHTIVEDWPAAQTMQLGDMDLDGDIDVMAGINRTRAEAIGETTFPVAVFLSSGPTESHLTGWTHIDVSDDGIYNGQIADVDGDGDLDLFRLPAHDATHFELLLNQTR